VPRFHFYLLNNDDLILDIVDVDLVDDHAAGDYAASLLARCPAVELMRGACVLGKVVRGRQDPI